VNTWKTPETNPEQVLFSRPFLDFRAFRAAIKKAPGVKRPSSAKKGMMPPKNTSVGDHDRNCRFGRTDPTEWKNNLYLFAQRLFR